MINRRTFRHWSRSWTRTLVAATLGAIVFVFAQALNGYPMHIADYVGAQIVRQGGYPEGAAGLIGWAVHIGVSLVYASVFGFLVSSAFLHGSKISPRITGLMLVPVLAYLSTAIAAPAIAVTAGLLSGQGLPASLPAFNLQLNFVFWNHALFFLVCWAVYLAPVGRRVENRRYWGSFLPAPRGALALGEDDEEAEDAPLELLGIGAALRGAARIPSCLRTRMSAALDGMRAFARSADL